MIHLYRILAVACLSVSAPLVAAETYELNIAPQPLATALQQFAQQSGLQIVYYGKITAGHAASALSGTLTATEALKKLLAGTELEFEALDAHTIAITDAGTRDQRPQVSTSGLDAGTLRLAQTDTASSQGGDSALVDQEGARESGGEAQGVEGEKTTYNGQEPPVKEDLEEVVVTGTHIRGIEQPIGAHLIEIDEKQIRESGMSSVQDIVRTLPQNYGGGFSEDTRPTRFSNELKGTALDLRGLGFGSTLVLLNGRRMSPSGGQGSFTDISAIPVTAVEKIEVLPDGASALYGSDAVGGVVNILLRREYDGAQTSARIGSPTTGSMRQYLVGHTLGTYWDKGTALVSMQYQYRDSLPASARQEMNSDLREQGGGDFRITQCNPGTITVGSQTYAVPSGQDGRSLVPGDFTTGSTNRCNRTTGDILPEQRAWSMYGSLQQEVLPNVELFGDAAYADRQIEYGLPRGMNLLVPSSNAFYVNPTGGDDSITVQYDLSRDLASDSEAHIKSLDASVGASVNVGRGWRAISHLGVSSQRSDFRSPEADSSLMSFYLAHSDPAIAFNPFGDGSHTNPNTLQALNGSQTLFQNADSKMQFVSVIADGPIFSLPGGEIKLATGAEYREQSLDTALITLRRSGLLQTPPTLTSYVRQVRAVFTELSLPFVGPENYRKGLERLEVSLAGRYERYSDYGDAVVPRLGLRWAPTGSLSVRGSWSESFRAPHPIDLSEARNQWGILDLASPSGGGEAAVLLWSGNNAELVEETAKIWTVGLDWQPASTGFRIAANYFDIAFTDRIGAISSLDLLDPSVAAVLVQNPTAEQRAAACASPANFGNISSIAPGDCLTAPVNFLLDLRLRNEASVQESGVDIIGSFTRSTRYGQVSANLNVAYVIDYVLAITPTAVPVETLDTASNPLALKFRGSLGLARGGAGVVLTGNYADSYKYSVVEPNRKISSWTTLDLNVSYSFRSARLFQNTHLTFNVQNMLDEGPPFYNNPQGIGYDPVNADLLRRYVSVSLQKTW